MTEGKLSRKMYVLGRRICIKVHTREMMQGELVDRGTIEICVWEVQLSSHHSSFMDFADAFDFVKSYE